MNIQTVLAGKFDNSFKNFKKRTDDEFLDKLKDFTDEGRIEKRSDYNNFLRKDNVDAMHE